MYHAFDIYTVLALMWLKMKATVIANPEFFGGRIDREFVHRIFKEEIGVPFLMYTNKYLLCNERSNIQWPRLCQGEILRFVPYMGSPKEEMPPPADQNYPVGPKFGSQVIEKSFSGSRKMQQCFFRSTWSDNSFHRSPGCLRPQPAPGGRRGDSPRRPRSTTCRRAGGSWIARTGSRSRSSATTATKGRSSTARDRVRARRFLMIQSGTRLTLCPSQKGLNRESRNLQCQPTRVPSKIHFGRTCSDRRATTGRVGPARFSCKFAQQNRQF